MKYTINVTQRCIDDSLRAYEVDRDLYEFHCNGICPVALALGVATGSTHFKAYSRCVHDNTTGIDYPYPPGVSDWIGGFDHYRKSKWGQQVQPVSFEMELP